MGIARIRIASLDFMMATLSFMALTILTRGSSPRFQESFFSEAEPGCCFEKKDWLGSFCKQVPNDTYIVGAVSQPKTKLAHVWAGVLDAGVPLSSDLSLRQLPKVKQNIKSSLALHE